MIEKPLVPAGCPRCEVPILAGVIGGRAVAVDRFTLPRHAAVILARYFPGMIYTITIGESRTIYGTDYHDSERNPAVMVHKCGNRWYKWHTVKTNTPRRNTGESGSESEDVPF